MAGEAFYKFNFKKIIVHGGKFHADDLLCVAMAKVITSGVISYERKNTITFEDLDGFNKGEVIICDIGGGKYDHHQADAEVKENGHKYAACGLFYKDFASALFPDEDSINLFRQKYIEEVEEVDNGYTVKGALSQAIASFLPTWQNQDNESWNKQFELALNWLIPIIKNEQNQAVTNLAAKNLVVKYEKEMKDELLIIENYFPTQLLIDSKFKFEVSKSLRGGYQLLTVKKELNSLEDKVILPRLWTDKNNKPEGMTFIHNARFIACFDTKEHAIDAVYKWHLLERTDEDQVLEKQFIN